MGNEYCITLSSIMPAAIDITPAKIQLFMCLFLSINTLYKKMVKIKYSGMCRVCAGILRETFIAEAAANIKVMMKYTCAWLRPNFLINGM